MLKLYEDRGAALMAHALALASFDSVLNRWNVIKVCCSNLPPNRFSLTSNCFEGVAKCGAVEAEQRAGDGNTTIKGDDKGGDANPA